MDKIWDRNPWSRRSLAVVVGMKKNCDHADRQKSNAKKRKEQWSLLDDNMCVIYEGENFVGQIYHM